MATSVSAELLSGPILKVKWANRHFKELEADIGRWLESEPYRFSREVDDDGINKHLRIRANTPIPEHWGCMIGDIIHNLRAALDILATDLARANGATSKSATTSTYFPIAKDRDAFEKGSWNAKRRAYENPAVNKIARLSEADRKRICDLKPYKGGNDLLWQLHQLDILDKHTLLVPAAASLLESNPFAYISDDMIKASGGKVSVSVRFGHIKKFPLEDGDILASYPVTQPDSHVDAKATITVAFGKGQIVDGEPVLETLNQFGEAVDSIIETYRKVYATTPSS